jgi:D-3-phosphoglycerate dehydrogenase
MSSARDIKSSAPIAKRPSVSTSWGQQNLSTSPTATFQSPSNSYGGAQPRKSAPKPLKPFNTQDIKILLLENVNQTGRDILTGQGYQVEFLKSSLPEDQLIEKIR